MLTFTETMIPGVSAAKYRDLNLIRVPEASLVFTCDSIGSVGALAFDAFHRTPDEAGRSYFKSVWMELLASGAEPIALYGDFSYQETDCERQICQSIREELRILGSDPAIFHASFGEAANPKCTSFGITAVGRVPSSGLRLGRSAAGDAVFALGLPSSKDDQTQQCTPQDVQRLVSCGSVHEILPCGSHGIRGELSSLVQTTGLQFDLLPGNPLCNELDSSCGPAGVLLVTAVPNILSQLEVLCPNHPITLLGTLSGNADPLDISGSDTSCTLLADGSIQIGRSTIKTVCATAFGKGMKRLDGPVRVPSENIVRRLTAALIDRCKTDGAEPVLIINNLNFSMKGGGKATIAAIRELIEPFQMKPDYQLTGSTEDNHEPQQSGYDIRVFALQIS